MPTFDGKEGRVPDADKNGRDYPPWHYQPGQFDWINGPTCWDGIGCLLEWLLLPAAAIIIAAMLVAAFGLAAGWWR